MLYNLLVRHFLRFVYYLLYHPFAWTYDLVADLVSLGRWDEWRRVTIPQLRGKSVLELGFGTGHLQVALMQAGFQACGLDESRQMAHLARRNLEQAGLSAALVRGRAQDLPYASGSFDNLVATFPSEYITARASLDEFWRVLKPGGRLVVVPMASFGNTSLSEKAAGWLFNLTGHAVADNQDLVDRVTNLFSQPGFAVEIRREPVRGSVVLLVIAEKPLSDR